MSGFVRHLLCNRDGATAVQHGIIAALIALVMMTGMNFIGNSISATMTPAATKSNG
jgi:Flp pilus assembly pilin Flp